MNFEKLYPDRIGIQMLVTSIELTGRWIFQGDLYKITLTEKFYAMYLFFLFGSI
uniref:Uncharacterized protein n=1 Tax=Arundo donax TaxID=35708 RepID=A0A0A9ESB4_ARUDO